MSQPEWKIRGLDQIKILGNTNLSTQTLERLLPVTYPSSLIRVQPQTIVRQLQTYAHVEEVAVSRQLFPPQINVVVQERSPVAKVRCQGCILVHDGQTPFEKSDTWLIDAAGVALPQSSYPNLEPQSIPQLEIDGYLIPDKSSKPKKSGKPVVIDPQQQKQLKTMLPLLLGSPVAIQRLDWRDKDNLKLNTPLGLIHLSQTAQTPQKLRRQIEALDQLRSLPSKIDLSTVAHLNLSDPDRPTLTLKAKPNKQKAVTPSSP